ncbi:hypothetical protein F4604DRAFT_1576172, partial [Suillus subluteus]
YHQDSLLKFTIMFPNNYPECLPTVQFLTDIFHPLVDPWTGAYKIDKELIHTSRPKEYQIHHILHFIKGMFKEPTLNKLHKEDVLNKEAFNYCDNQMSFVTLVKQFTELSQSPSALYDTSGSKKSQSLWFTPLKPNELDKVLRALSVHTEYSK